MMTGKKKKQSGQFLEFNFSQFQGNMLQSCENYTVTEAARAWNIKRQGAST